MNTVSTSHFPHLPYIQFSWIFIDSYIPNITILRPFHVYYVYFAQFDFQKSI